MITMPNITSDIEANDYLIALSGSTIVVKYGGSVIAGGAAEDAFVHDCATLYRAGVRLVIVHGGGAAVTATAARLGVETRFIEGQRYTDTAMMEVLTMVLAGRVNTDLVRLLTSATLPAVGLSGVDGTLLVAEKLTSNEGTDLGYVGDVASVNKSLIDTLVDNGYIPVVATVAADSNGTLYNINADLAAAALAGALGADILLFMSDVTGVVVDGEVARSLTADDIENLVKSGEISGGMIPKTSAALAALRKGAFETRILDGREIGALGDALVGEFRGTTIILGE